MRGFNHNLVVTTAYDEATGTEKPLFAFPVQVCKATESIDPKFDRAAPSGAPYETVYRDTMTGEVIGNGDLIRGIRQGDSFTAIADEQIKAIDESLASKDIAVQRVVTLDEVPWERTTAFHYLQVPQKLGGAPAYHLTYEGLKAAPKKGKKAARPALGLLVKYVARTRQKLAVIFANEEKGCLMMVTLCYAAEVRQPDEQVLAHLHAEVEEPMIAKVREVFDHLNEGDEIDAHVDEAVAARQALVEKALMGEAIPAPIPEAAVIATDAVEDAIEKSIASLA